MTDESVRMARSRPARPRWLRSLCRSGFGRAIRLPTLLSGWTAQPYRLRTTRIALPAAPGSPAGLRAALVTDLHVRHPDRGVAPRVVRLLRDLRPDLVLVSGDTHDHPRWTAPVVEHLARYRAPLGVFAVPGNHEHRWGVDVRALREALRERGVTMLLNEWRAVEAAGRPLVIVGVDDPVTRRHDLEAALAGAPEGYRVLLAHSGVILEEARARGVPLVLSGHTHGGQVVLPLVGIPWLPRRIGPCVRGVHRARGTTLVVSAGAGMSILPVRYGSPPEIVLLEWERS